MSATSIGPVDIEFAMKDFNVEAAIAQLKAQISSIGTTAQQGAKTTGSAFQDMGKMLAAYLTAQQLTSFAGNIANARGEMQQLSISLEAMLKSKTKSDQLIADSVALAAHTPFTLQDVGAGTKSLIAYQFAQKDVIKTLTMLGDVASGTSTPLSELVYLYGTSKTQGRLFTKDIMQFAGRGIPIIAELAKQFNVSNAQLMKMVEAGKVGFPQLQKAFESMTSSTGMFGGLMEKNSKSITGQLSNLKDAWFQAMNEMGKDNEGLISGVISGTGSLVAHWREVADIIGVVVATYGAYKAATMVVAVMNEVNAAGSLATALKQTAAAQELLNLAQKASPAGMVLVGVTALIGAYVAWERHAGRVSEGQQAINKAIAEESVKVSGVFDITKKAAAGTKERADAIKIINDRYGDYLTNLLTEKSSLNDIENAQKRVTQAMMADAGSKAATAGIEKKLSSYNKKFNSELSDYIDSFAKTFGSDRVPELVERLNTAVDSAAKESKGETWSNKWLKFQFSGDATKIYDEFIRKTGKGTLDGFITDFFDVVAEKADINPELAVLQSQATHFQSILSQFQKAPKTNADSNKPEVDKDAFAKALEERKKQYELYYKWVSSMGEESANAQFAKLVAGGKSYREYLLKEINSGKNNKEQTFTLKSALADVDQIKKPFDAFKDEVKSTKESSADLADYIAYLNEEIKKLSGKESENDKQKLGFLNEEKIKATNEELTKTIEAFDELMKKTQNYDAQRLDVETKYTADVQLLEKRRTSIGEEEYAARLAMLKKNKAKELDDIADAAFEETDIAKRIADNKRELSNEELKTRIADIQKALDEEEFSAEKKKELERDLTDTVLQLLDQREAAMQRAMETVNNFASTFVSITGKDSGITDLTQSVTQMASAYSKMGDIQKQLKAGTISTAEASKMGSEAMASGYMAVLSVIGKIYEIGLASAKAQIAAEREAYMNAVKAYAVHVETARLLRESARDRMNFDEAHLNALKEEQSILQSQKDTNTAAFLDATKKLNDLHSELDVTSTRSRGTTPSGKTDVVANAFYTSARDDAGNFLSKAAAAEKLIATLKALDAQGKLSEEDKVFYDQMQALYDEGININNALNDAIKAQQQILTGTTSSSISDAIIEGFKNGKYAAADYADNFKELMRESMLSLAADNALQPAMEAWYNSFAAASESDGGLSKAEVADLQKQYEKNIEDYNKLVQQMSDASGIALASADSGSDKNSLSGAVKGVTQETASLVAGQMNAIRINQAKGVAIMDKQLKSLSNIESYTAYLLKIYELIKNNNNLRAKGL